MNTTSHPNFAAVLRGAGRLAMQWRLLLLWVAALLIPTALLGLPIWRLLASRLDHSVHAAELARHLDMNSLYDLIAAASLNGLAMAEAGVAALVLTLLLAPFLSGAMIAAARAQAPLALGNLIHGGISNYGRMLRMFIWSLVPLGIAGGLGTGAMQLAKDYAEKAILESHANLAGHAALALMVLLLALAHATVEAGRAQLAADARRRSAVKAWWQACKLACKQPLATFGVYFAFTLAGLALLALLGMLRINMPHADLPGFVAALLLTQMMAAISGWMRGARLFGLVDLAMTKR
jgi:hypothetical protein